MKNIEESLGMDRIKKNTISPRLVINNAVAILILLVFPLITVLGVTVLNRGGVFEGADWFMTHPLEDVYNYLLAFAIINIFTVFFKSKIYLLVSVFIAWILFMLAYVSYIKTSLRGEPLSILDFRIMNEATNIVDVLSFRYYVPIIVLVAAVLITFAFVIFFVDIKFSLSTRIVASVASLLILLVGYTSTIDFLSKIKVTIPADVSWNHDTNGFMLGSLIDSKFLKIPKPAHYSRKTIEETYKRMQEKTAVTTQAPEVKPNVIFIMSEAFWDLSIAKDLQLSKEVIPNFKELSKKSATGFIEVPGIGGGTANTEYEVLTGLSKKFIRDYNVPYNPYNSYIHKPIYSLATIFSELDYSTKAIHTYQSWFYRRNEVYKHLGFAEFISLETLGNAPKINGMFTDDEVVNDLIMSEMKKTKRKDFIYAVTMQGHGPYDDMNSADDGIKVNNSINDKSKKIIENYANNLHEVDKDIGQLIKTVENFSEPTIIVYFGDHIPPFGEEVYKQIDFNTYEPFGKKTPLIIWSNYKTFNDKIDFHANMLGAYVLDKIGVKNNLYMNYVNSYSKVSPLINPDENESFYHDFELLQYDIMHGNQYYYELAGKPRENRNYSIGDPIELKQAKAEEKDNEYLFIISGKGIGQTSVVYLNGKDRPTEVRDGNQALFSVPKADVNHDKPIELVVKLIDSRGKVIKKSNSLLYDSISKIVVKD